MNRSSKNRMTKREAFLFPGETLYAEIARAVCRAETLPRKEFHEAWEVARRVRRHFRGGRVWDLACGHGLLGHIMLILDDSSPEAILVDRTIPPKGSTLSQALMERWPRLKGRVHYRQMDLDEIIVQPQDIVISVHACGSLTDLVIDKGLAANARLAVLPCCHDLSTCHTGGLEGWMDGPLAVDAMRAARLTAHGYKVMTKTIPQDVTPKNRLLMGLFPTGE